MRFRLASNIAAKVEGVRLALEYPTLTDAVNLLLDAIRHRWNLKLSNIKPVATEELRIRLADRHIEWLSQYGTERGLNIPSATNLVISDHFRNVLSQSGTGDNKNESFVPTLDEKPLLSVPKVDGREPKLTEVDENSTETNQQLPKITESCPESGQEKAKGKQLLRGLKI